MTRAVGSFSGQKTLDECFSTGEKIFNRIGYIPFVSSVSGAIRCKIGLITAVAAAILTAGAFVFEPLTGKTDFYIKIIPYIDHGCSNCFRGMIESIPILGNLLCLAYDQDPGRRLWYPTEQLPPGYAYA